MNLYIQATSFCNINCDYCYVEGRENSSVLGIEYLHKLANLLKDKKDKITIIWHLGEPLSAGLPFFKRAFEAFERLHVKHKIVTNGIILNEEWVRFLKCADARIVISCDGPSHIHNKHRIGRTGQSTHEKVERSIISSRNAGILDAVLCTVTERSIRNAAEIYHYFKKLRVPYLGVNVYRTLNPSLNEESSVNYDLFVPFWRELFNSWVNDKCELFIRELYRVVKLHSARSCFTVEELQDNLSYSISKNGDVYHSIAQIAGMPTRIANLFHIGNVIEMKAFPNSHNHTAKEKIIRSNYLCRSVCDYYEFCGGGYILEKLAEHNSLEFSETAACRHQIKALVDAVLPQVH